MKFSMWLQLAVVGLTMSISTQSRAGVLYVSSYNSGNSTGTIETVAPGGSTTTFASGLHLPYGMAFDSAGNLYVAIVCDDTVDKITPGGVVSVFASTGLSEPVGLAFDASGNLYVSNAAGTTIEKFTPGGVGSTFATGIPFGYGLVIDKAGNVYVAEGNSDTIEKFTPGGVGSTFATGLGQNSIGLAIDANGNLYSSSDSTEITKITPGGVKSDFATVPAGGNWSLAVDSSGNVYSANWYSGNITEFTPSGVGTLIASGFMSPTGLVAAAVPEPSSFLTLCVGLGLIGASWSLRNPNAARGHERTRRARVGSAQPHGNALKPGRSS